MPKPLFPNAEILEKVFTTTKFIPQEYLNKENDWKISAQFLLNYKYSYETFKTYRKDIEKLLLWTWIYKTEIKNLSLIDIQEYLDFIQKPHKNWVIPHHIKRYLDEENALLNPKWRPCIQSKKDQKIKIKTLLAIINSYFNYLVDHDYILKNPLKRLRQKKHLVAPQHNKHIVRKLSKEQWQMVIYICEKEKTSSFHAMRNWWMMGIFFLLGVRISEISSTNRYCPNTLDFYLDHNKKWWLKVLGKGNKFRDIAIPNELITMFLEFRKYLNLPEHISPQENISILPKEKNLSDGIGIRQVRKCVDECFQRAANELESNGQINEALKLREATVHYLRHTSISEAVKVRPIEHVRDDAGHSSIMITDLYIDTDRNERHKSAQRKNFKNHVDDDLLQS